MAAIVPQQATVENGFIAVFQNIMSLSKGEYDRSTRFKLFGHYWSLVVYPFGTNSTNGHDSVSVFLIWHGPYGQGTPKIHRGIEAPKLEFMIRATGLERPPETTRFMTYSTFYDILGLRLGEHNWCSVSDLLNSDAIREDGSIEFTVRMKGPDVEETNEGHYRFAILDCMLKAPDALYGDMKLRSGRGQDCQVIKAHRSVLAARFEFFSVLLKSDALEGSTDGLVVLEDIGSQALRIFVNYAYCEQLPTNELVRNWSTLLDLWKFACGKFFLDLDKKCAKIVEQCVSSATFEDSFNTALELSKHETQKALALKFHDMSDDSVAFQAIAQRYDINKIIVLVRCMPASVKTFRLVDAWARRRKDRLDIAQQALNEVQITAISRECLSEPSVLGVIEAHGSRELLMNILRSLLGSH